MAITAFYGIRSGDNPPLFSFTIPPASFKLNTGKRPENAAAVYTSQGRRLGFEVGMTFASLPTHSKSTNLIFIRRFPEMPASRFFDLIQKIQPDAKRWDAGDYNETLGSLEPFLK